MLARYKRDALIRAFVSWGHGLVERAWLAAQIHGVLCSANTFSDGANG